jgi:hypothetical protein
MLPHHAPAPQSADRPCRCVGVGIDTSRYGHYAAFLRDDLQPAAAELQFAESADGYRLLRQRLEQIRQRYGPVAFVVRLDAAGQYADNLLHFLHGLGTTRADAAPLRLTLSCGDPQRNKNYRAALFGGNKSDPLEARAAARYALTEKPTSDIPLSLELRTLRQVAGRLNLLPQNLLHRFSFCELINQLVQVANFLHQRIFYVFHANTAHDACDKRTIWMNGGCFSKKGLNIGFLFDLLL